MVPASHKKDENLKVAFTFYCGTRFKIVQVSTGALTTEPQDSIDHTRQPL